MLECEAILHLPLRMSLAQLQLGAIEPGSVRPGGYSGRFPVLRRLGPTAVVPRQEGIEGWLWTTIGGSAMVSVGDEEDAPNAALLLTKPLGEETVARVFQRDFLEDLAERSPLGAPVVLGFVFRAAETMKLENVYRQFGLLKPLTDREVPPTMRRALPGDHSADSASRSTSTPAPPPLWPHPALAKPESTDPRGVSPPWPFARADRPVNPGGPPHEIAADRL